MASPLQERLRGIFDTVLQALRLVRKLTLYLQEEHNVEARLRGEDYHLLHDRKLGESATT